MKDLDFIKKFESCQLSAEEFTHKNHVRMAFIYLRSNNFPEALILIRNGIKKFAGHHQVDGLYNETITFWYSTLVNDRLAKSGEVSWKQFKKQNGDLFVKTFDFLKLFYKIETIQSLEAKKKFLLPDFYPL